MTVSVVEFLNIGALLSAAEFNAQQLFLPI
ncbi:hypothetical protein Asal01_02341 [Fodinibius salicampi]